MTDLILHPAPDELARPYTIDARRAALPLAESVEFVLLGCPRSECITARPPFAGRAALLLFTEGWWITEREDQEGQCRVYHWCAAWGLAAAYDGGWSHHPATHAAAAAALARYAAALEEAKEFTVTVATLGDGGEPHLLITWAPLPPDPPAPVPTQPNMLLPHRAHRPIVPDNGPSPTFFEGAL